MGVVLLPTIAGLNVDFVVWLVVGDGLVGDVDVVGDVGDCVAGGDAFDVGDDVVVLNTVIEKKHNIRAENKKIN